MSDERLSRVETELNDLTHELIWVKGKALGLEAALLTLAREWGNEPQAVIEALHQSMEVLDDPQKCPGLAGTQKRVAMEIVEQVSSALHSRNR